MHSPKIDAPEFDSFSRFQYCNGSIKKSEETGICRVAPMAKRESIPVVSLFVASISFLGLLGCGLACFSLDHALKLRRSELSETQSQLIALNQALEIQRHDLSEARQQLASATNQIAETQKTNQALAQHLTESQASPRSGKATGKAAPPPVQIPANVPDVPAPDSVEGKLKADGKIWERADGQPMPGGYVLDILNGRADQPKGRGRVGVVLSMVVNADGGSCALVDFGHGYIVGIATAELAPLRLVGPDLR